MAFTRSWDESQPDGTESASDIDLEIRKLKEDLRERLEDVSTFGTDTDPLALSEGSARITVDTSGNKPGSPTYEGEMYYETDTDDLYIAEDDGGLTWVQFSPAGTLTSADVADYDDSQSAGSKVTEEATFNRVIHLYLSGTTDASGDIQVDFDELTSADLQNLATANESSVILSSDDTAVAAVRVSSINRLGNTITLRFFDFTGSAITSTAVTAMALFYLDE